jgi:hypothetical protein
VCFSCKHYGFTLIRSWLDTFVQKYLQKEASATNTSSSNSKDSSLSNASSTTSTSTSTSTSSDVLQGPQVAVHQSSAVVDDVVAVEICFVEYGFLSMAHNLFASSLKSQVQNNCSTAFSTTFTALYDCPYLHEYRDLCVRLIYLY